MKTLTATFDTGLNFVNQAVADEYQESGQFLFIKTPNRDRGVVRIHGDALTVMSVIGRIAMFGQDGLVCVHNGECHGHE